MKTEIIKVHPEFPELDQINYCANVIRKGGLVVFPTETVYGIAADFNNIDAMRRLREVKKRSEGKPFSILVSQIGLISNYTSISAPAVYKLVYEYWPGPLTVIVPSREVEGTTIGVRMPDNIVALKLVQESQKTIAAPSANFEGSPPPKTCEEALRDLDGLVDVAIDGGEAQYGKASSVVDFTQGAPSVLREGAVTQQQVDEVTNRKTVLFVCTGNSCRSVMAEYLLRDKMKDRAEVDVSSAGTSVFISTSASMETVSVLRSQGIDASRHMSQPLSTILLKKSDLILVMTRAHRQMVLDRVPEVEKRVYLLREFAQTANGTEGLVDIPDPIGKPAEAYEECMLTIKDSIEKISQLL